jgi:hypothetical protein
MKTRLLGFIAAAVLLGAPATASAALIPVTLNDVTIDSTVYDVTFYQDDGGSTTFNDVFGSGSPTLTFTTLADALAAATAVRAAGDAANFDYTGAPFLNVNGFVLPFAYSATDYSFVMGLSDDPLFEGVFGPFDHTRTAPHTLAFAVFTPAAVPEPVTLSLFGIGVVALCAARLRRKHHPVM